MEYKYYRILEDIQNTKFDRRCKHGSGAIKAFEVGGVLCRRLIPADDFHRFPNITWIHKGRHIANIDYPVEHPGCLAEIPVDEVPLRDRVMTELGDCLPWLAGEILDRGLVSFEQLKEIHDEPE